MPSGGAAPRIVVTATTKEPMYPAITVRQPWAWAILHAGKDVENRPWAPTYRGPVWIHASANQERLWVPGAGDVHELYARAWRFHGERIPYGCIIGRVTITGVHHADECPAGGCSTWAAPDQYHLQLADPITLEHPVKTRGKLRLWNPGADLIRKLGQ